MKKCLDQKHHDREESDPTVSNTSFCDSRPRRTGRGIAERAKMRKVNDSAIIEV